MAATTAMRRLAVLAIATPAFCETVKGGDVGGSEVALFVVELGGGRATVTVFVGPVTDALTCVVDIVGTVELVVGAKRIIIEVAPSELVLLSVGVGSVEVFQFKAREVFEAYSTVLLTLACCPDGTSAPLRGVADSDGMMVNVMFQPSCTVGLIGDCCSVKSDEVTVADVVLSCHEELGPRDNTDPSIELVLSTNVKMELTVGTGTEGVGALPANVEFVILKGVVDRYVPEEATAEGVKYSGVLLATVADEISCVRGLTGCTDFEVSLRGAEVFDPTGSLSVEVKGVVVYVTSAGIVDSETE
jgi:hypothetical protein